MMSSRSVKKLNAGIVLMCTIGMGLSYYAYVVETTKERDASYEALCDISDRISCSKVFTSKYGKGFGIIPKDSALYKPNSVYGLIFYTLMAVLGIRDTYYSTVVLIFFGILSNITSMYLASILFLLKDICVVCVSTYIVNAINLVLGIRKYHAICASSKKKQKTK